MHKTLGVLLLVASLGVVTFAQTAVLCCQKVDPLDPGCYLVQLRNCTDKPASGAVIVFQMPVIVRSALVFGQGGCAIEKIDGEGGVWKITCKAACWNPGSFMMLSVCLVRPAEVKDCRGLIRNIFALR